MDFCLSIARFVVGIVYFSAMCFHTGEERRVWVRDNLHTEQAQWLALYCDRRKLKEEYAARLGVDDVETN